MITSIATIRARHARPLPPAPEREADKWLAAVDRAAITRLRRGDGYILRVGSATVVEVLPPDRNGHQVVINRAAGGARSPAVAPHLADTMAMRIARMMAAG